jgi:hypothetical protein
MSTRAHEVTRWVADQWENHMDYKSAVFSGIVGDPKHRARGGYHISIEDQSSNNYSVVRKDDKAPPGNWPRDLAAAIDMSMSTPDMKKCHARLKAVWKDKGDPRRVFLNAFNGWDGDNGAGRYDYVSNDAGSASSDHKWHTHLEIRRKWVTSWVAASAIVSILMGQTKSQYQANPPKTPKMDDVVTPVPKPKPPVTRPAPGPAVPFPLPRGYYFGPKEGGNESVSGHYGRRFKGHTDRYWLQVFVNQLIKRGWSIGKGRSYLPNYGNDGKYGGDEARLIKAFQKDQGLVQDGLVGPRTWNAAFHNPVT